MSAREEHYRSDQPVDERRIASPILVWYGFLTPPIAWGAHLLVTYFLEAWFCGSGMANVDLWINIFTAIFLAATVLAGVASWWAWSVARIGDDTSDATEWGISGFLAVSGLIMSILFGLAIIMGDFGVFYLTSCQAP